MSNDVSEFESPENPSTGSACAGSPFRSLPWPASNVDRLLWIVVAMGAFGTIGSLVRFWGIQTEYADRFLVLFGSAWAAYQLWPNAAAAPRHPRPLLALPFLTAAAVIVPFGWFLQVQTTGGRAAILWLQGGGLLLLAAASILARYGFARLKVLAFPLMFCTFALPIPSMFAAPMQTQLQHLTTNMAETALPILGVPVLQRDGFVLRLSSGDLGVAAACSGVRSMTALTALAAFIAYLRGLGILRGILLEAATVLIVAVVNGVRVVASGLIQERFGEQYIRGEWHEALGISMVFLGLGIIVQVSKLLRLRIIALILLSILIVATANILHVVASLKLREWLGEEYFPDNLRLILGIGIWFLTIGMLVQMSKIVGPISPLELPGEPLPSGRPGFGGALALASVLLTATLSAVAVYVGVTANSKFVAKAPFEEIPMTLGEGRTRWSGKDLEVKDYVTEMLGQDKALFREYENNTGQRVYVWALFWSTADMVKGYHHPDVCWGNKGYVSTAKRIENVEPGTGGTIPATVREFQREHMGGKVQEHQFVLYWTQEGPRVWDDRDERNALAGGFFFDPKMWFGEETKDEAVTGNGRLVVLVCTPATDAASKTDALKFTRLFSDELYRVCPWAGPPHPPIR